ncbi:MAG TPA: ABC transporter ATP-binding protein [Thermoleophilia bacterium]|nr:ABC transporter ATP-binding protein [Thermoleophilia bacterium]
MDGVVQTASLTKRYSTTITAVDHLDLRVGEGEIYGFLGPNGAGKTTTLRMLLGLIRPTSGTATVMGHRPGEPAGLAEIGALIETPAFYPYLSGRDNLRVLARMSGTAFERIDETLAQVGLSSRADDKFKKYSLGMKQRLGVGAALLKDPAFLILDEPTNGLDPQGMAEMRTLIRQLGNEGRSVLLSSHLLGEIEQICDRVGVIREGKLIAEGTVAELQQRGQGIVVRAEPQAQAYEVLTRLPFVSGVRATDGSVRVTVAPEHAAEINTALVGAGLAVNELRPAGRSLEEAFFELTGGGENGDARGDEGSGPSPAERSGSAPDAGDGAGANAAKATDTEVRAA